MGPRVPPAGQSGWPLACGVLVTCTSLAGRGWLRGTLAWSTTVTSWLWGPSHLIALIPFSPCVTWNGIGSPLGWIVGASAAPPVGSAPSRARERQKGSAREPAEACGNKGCWARWVSWPLPGRGSPAREAFPSRGQQRVGEQGALGGAFSWEGCP